MWTPQLRGVLYNLQRRAFSAKGIPIVMPALSPTMTSGKVAKWTKKEGDQ